MNTETLKEASNQYLKSMGITVNKNLPLIENISEVKPRSAKDVASRICAISYVIGMAYDADKNKLIKYLKDYNLWSYVSHNEQSLLKNKDISEQEIIDIEWLTECSQALAWCLGLVEMDHFKDYDEDLPDKIPIKKDPTEFINNSKLRSIEEIQSQSDLLYRMHWYTKHIKFYQKSKLNQSIIVERRKAIDWVYGTEENWDEVPLDT